MKVLGECAMAMGLGAKHALGSNVRISMLLALISLTFPAIALSATLEITARFEPTSLDPGHNTFVNTTPNSGICRSQPGWCQSRGVNGSIEVPLGLKYGEFTLDAPERSHAYFRFPNEWQELAVVHQESGAVFKLKWRIVLLGGRYVLYRDVKEITGTTSNLAGHGALWSSIWSYPPAGCQGVGSISAGATWYDFQWYVPIEGNACTKLAKTEFEGMRIDNVGIGYVMEAPNPLEMPSGTYTASAFYGIGPGMEFDFGDNASTEVDHVSINFTLTVQHSFDVQFPATVPRVTLTPDGGWSQWIDHGRPPTRLRQELPFHLTTSMDFSMKLRCEYETDGRCGIRNALGETVVPVEVDVTIPGMNNVRDGRPAQDAPLLPDDVRAPRFTPDGYLIRRRSTLRFTAGGEAVAEMLKSPGSYWQGNMTVVFDANP